MEEKREIFTDEKEIEKRKEKVIKFFKEKSNWIYYLILTAIISISVYIRTRPIPKLKDITTGAWTLGPDLDPFLFLRWAKYIAKHGKLFLLDTMRYVPLAKICSGDACNPVNTAKEMKLLSYMIAWLSKFLSVFNKDVTVTYAAIIFPVLMAILTGIAFFLFARKIFYKEDKKIANIIALIATAFFILIPSLLPRTIAGIPEKESAAFFFIFICFYLFLEAFTSQNLKRGLIFGVLAGVTTGIMGLVWGAIEFPLLTITAATLFSFLFGKMDKKRFYIFGVWLVSFVLTAMPFSIRYTLKNLISSSSTALVFMVFFIFIIDFLLFKKKIFNIGEKIKKRVKLPEPVISLVIAITLGIIFSFIFSRGLLLKNLAEDIISSTINPISLNRFSVTVAENKQPYFVSDWINNFGPVVFNIPLYFWMLIAGSILLFYSLIGQSFGKKEKGILTTSYFIMLICLVFSKYAPHPHPLDGEGPLSLIVYFGGAILFLGTFGYFYYESFRKKEFSIFKKLNYAYILYFVSLTLAIISARGAIRLIMVLGAISPVAVAFLIVKSSKGFLKEKEETKKLFIGIFVLILLISSTFILWTYYNSDKSLAEDYAPNIYTQQWQKAMAWVRENTPKDSVFAHWWDYGYWVQSLGERATILDGGNMIGYWNYFMGRNVLTTTNERDALDFLYAHNGTHLLIDSTDIGKYTAFSSIGSDSNYDRFSWIPTIFMDERQTQERNNETYHVYPVGVAVDNDIMLNKDGNQILLPRQKAIVVAIMTKEKKDGTMAQPVIFFMYNNHKYQIPLKYVYVDKKMYDFQTGIDAGIFIFPSLSISSGNMLNINKEGAALYLSKRTIHSQFARLYLFNENSDYFKLVHSEDNQIIESLKAQGIMEDFVYYNGLQGPIKIWEISYPSDIKLNELYLNTKYPKELEKITPGEY